MELGLKSETKRFLVDSKSAIDSFLNNPAVERFISILKDARQRRKNVFVFGNGGSSATASHFVCDLLKTSIVKGKPRFKAYSLTDNVPVMTAWSNDVSYSDIFAEQLKNFLESGDIAIAISGSGNSPNVLRGTEFAKENGAVTVGLTGNSGKLAGMVDICIKVPSSNILLIEGAHSVLLHYVTEVLREA
ncbi:MAG: SIS domain-containing protein [Thaumarchaeota archaeon]|nr:SIS domain-containing protein [Nitrososphaerota archaeon]